MAAVEIQKVRIDTMIYTDSETSVISSLMKIYNLYFDGVNSPCESMDFFDASKGGECRDNKTTAVSSNRRGIRADTTTISLSHDGFFLSAVVQQVNLCYENKSADAPDCSVDHRLCVYASGSMVYYLVSSTVVNPYVNFILIWRFKFCIDLLLFMAIN